MKIERHDADPISPEDQALLEKLKALVEKSLEDGKLSPYEISRIKSLMWSNGKITYEELRTLHETIESVMGELPPEFEWSSYS